MNALEKLKLQDEIDALVARQRSETMPAIRDLLAAAVIEKRGQILAADGKSHDLVFDVSPEQIARLQKARDEEAADNTEHMADIHAARDGVLKPHEFEDRAAAREARRLVRVSVADAERMAAGAAYAERQKPVSAVEMFDREPQSAA